MTVSHTVQVFALVLPSLEMDEVLRLRVLSTSTLQIITTHLGSTLLDLLRSRVPNPEAFLSALSFSEGFVVGSLAVTFLLRQELRPPPEMIDVVLPHNDKFHAFLFHLLIVQNGRMEFNKSHKRSPPKMGVAVVAHIRTPMGYVAIYQSNSRHALLPITMSPISCQISYVNATHFGTAYPHLLFKRRALVADLARSTSSVVGTYNARGFSLRMFVGQWEDREDEGICAAETFECPAQVRTFVDEGFMAIRMRPLESYRLRPRVAWRLDVRPCGGDCFTDTSIIRRWHVVARVF